MADRYWRIGENMGYAGTESTDVIDLCEYMDMDEAAINNLSQEDVLEELSQDAWNRATERISSWAEPVTEDDYKNES